MRHPCLFTILQHLTEGKEGFVPACFEKSYTRNIRGKEDTYDYRYHNEPRLTVRGKTDYCVCHCGFISDLGGHGSAQNIAVRRFMFVSSWYHGTGLPVFLLGVLGFVFTAQNKIKGMRCLLRATEVDIVFEHYDYRQERNHFSIATVACGCHSDVRRGPREYPVFVPGDSMLKFCSGQ